MKRIGIIGAGLSGLLLANRLQDKAKVTVFEKSRGVSGRLATRRIGAYEFDHGAQFMTARSKKFKKFLQTLINEGEITEWQPRVLTLSAGENSYIRPWFEPHYVGTPAMTTRGMDVEAARRIAGWIAEVLHAPQDDAPAMPMPDMGGGMGGMGGMM